MNTQQLIWACAVAYVAGILTMVWLNEKSKAYVQEKKRKIEDETKAQLKEIEGELKFNEPDYKAKLQDFTDFHATNAEILRKHGIEPIQPLDIGDPDSSNLPPGANSGR